MGAPDSVGGIPRPGIVVGGALIVLSAGVGLIVPLVNLQQFDVQLEADLSPANPLIAASNALWSFGVLVAAVGVRREDSVVARRAPALIAILLLVLVTNLTPVMPLIAAAWDNPLLFTALNSIAQLVRLALAVFAALMIVLTGAVRSPWCWVPLLCALILAVVSAATQAFAQIALDPRPAFVVGPLLWNLTILAFGVTTIRFGLIRDSPAEPPDPPPRSRATLI